VYYSLSNQIFASHKYHHITYFQNKITVATASLHAAVGAKMITIFLMLNIFLISQCFEVCQHSRYVASPARCRNSLQKTSYVDMKANSKKTKKKEKPSAPPDAQISQTSQQPSRVTNKINIPVRQQIAWAKAYKRLMTTAAANIPVNRTKFRQVRGPKDTEEYDQQYEGIDYDSINSNNICRRLQHHRIYESNERIRYSD